MKKTLQTLALILWVVGSSFGQCPNTNLYTFCPALDASNLVLGTITPVCVMVAGDYQIINNIVAGNTYRISFCNAIGSDNPPTAHDSFMTVYGPGGFVVFNDNHCGTNSQVEFVAPSSGTYRVLCNVSGNCSASNFILTPTTITLVNAPSSALTVSSINRANTSPSNSSVVNYTVTFSGNVSGLVASNFTLSTTGGITGASVGTPTGSGNTWTVPVNTGSGDGTLRLDLANAMGLSPTVTTPYNSGQIYDIDKTPPTVSIGAPSVSSTTCGPVTYTITYSGATSISLTNANVSVNAPSTFVVNVAVSGTGTNTRTVTLSGISGNGVVGITIAPNTATDAAGNAAASATTGSNNTFSVTAPSAGINPSSTSVCVGAQVSLNGTGSSTYSWSASGGGFTSNSSNPTAWSASTPGNYTVSLTAGSGTCTASATQVITVNANPTLSVTPPATQCGGSINLSTVFSSNGSLTYFTENTFTNTAANPVTASGTYYARAELNGCTATASVAVTINPLPTLSVTPPSVACGGSVDLSTVFSTSGTLSYFTENTFTNIAANPVTASGTYYARAELNGCTATASVALSILSNPPVQVVSNSPACAGTTLNLSALGGTSWTWSGPASFTSNVQYPNRPVLSGNMSGTYSVTISTANGCTQVATTRVVVNPVVSGEVSSNSPICVGNTLRLSASGGSSYTWSGPGFGSSVQNPTRTGGTAAIAGAYSVTVSGACGSASLTTPVVVSANIAPSIVSIQVNGQMPNAQNTVSVCNTQGISLTVAATNTAMYSWRGPTGAGSGFESSTASPVTMPVASPRTGQYTITARNGCTVFNHRVVNIQLIGCSNRLAAELPDPSRMGLSVAPNPVTEQLTIQMLQQRTTSVRVSVVDALGREMYTHDLKPEATSVQVSVKAWPTGWYVVSAEAEGYREYAKIIKQ